MNSIDIKLSYPGCTVVYQIDLISLTANVISSIGDKQFLGTVEYGKLPTKIKLMVECIRGECDE